MPKTAKKLKTGKGTGNPKLGAKIRRLRRDRGKTQAQLAEQLGVSASYLNLIEHNHRKVTVDMLLRLAEIFNLEMKDLAEGDESQLLADVMTVLGEDLFEELDLTNTDVRDFVSTSPQVARAMLLIHDALRSTVNDARDLASRLAEDDDDGNLIGLSSGHAVPADLVSDFMQESNNFYPDLEDEADRIRREIGIFGGTTFDNLVTYMKTALDVSVVLADQHVEFQRRFDPATRQLILSPRVDVQSRKFQIAHQIALLSAGPVIDMLLMEGRVREGEARNLGRVALANYLAAALLMPYDEFLMEAKQFRYDIELLQHRYNVSFEQVCQRLTSLNKSDNKGIPLHFLRVDIAGNISKRFTLSGLPIPRHGGACSRWNVYAAFMNPGIVQAQVSYLPDGAGFFCIARSIRKGSIGYGTQQTVFSLGLGCSLIHAHEMVYADGLDLVNREAGGQIGVQCKICDRMDCGQRAFPPIHQRFRVDENARGMSPYAHAELPYKQIDPGGTR